MSQHDAPMSTNETTPQDCPQCGDKPAPPITTKLGLLLVWDTTMSFTFGNPALVANIGNATSVLVIAAVLFL